MTASEKLISIAYGGALTSFAYAPFDSTALLSINNTYSFVVERIHWYSCRQHPRPKAVGENGIFLLQIKSDSRILDAFVNYQIPFDSQVLIGGARDTDQNVAKRLHHILIVTENGDCDIIFESLREVPAS